MNLPKLGQLGVGRRRVGDPLLAVGDAACRLSVREGTLDLDDEELCHQVVASFPCEVPNCQETFSTLLDFEMHYNSSHRFSCSQCRKELPSAHFLDLHLSETHDSFFAAQAERKPMFRCFVENCPVVSPDGILRKSHCIEDHNFPHVFPYYGSHKKSKTKTGVKPATTAENSATAATTTDNTAAADVPHGSKDIKHFTFGQGRRGKTFSFNKPWHAKGKKNKKTDTEISTTELMETLPPCDDDNKMS